MRTVKLNSKIQDGSVIFSISEPDDDFRFSQPSVINKIDNLYRDRCQLNINIKYHGTKRLFKKIYTTF